MAAAAPSPPTNPVPSLRDAALRLLRALPTSTTLGAHARSALASLPADARGRLQAALREAAAAAAASGVGSGGEGGQVKKPTIQLRTTFALPSK